MQSVRLNISLQGTDVLRTELNTTCIGAFYLEDLTLIQQKRTFDLIEAQEHAFQIAADQWIISSPVDFPTTLSCPKTFTSLSLRSSSTITVLPGC
jgi:hypothetical protein